jgi:hypothetical protein
VDNVCWQILPYEKSICAVGRNEDKILYMIGTLVLLLLILFQGLIINHKLDKILSKDATEGVDKDGK